jgi:threonine/homoserine/homoserine lactone efflux protein
VIGTGAGPSILTALGIGLALAGAPGPVQAVLLTEAVRGGVTRGLRALLGVHGTFGLVMAMLALGLSVTAPRGVALRSLKVFGGLFLLWLAFDALRNRDLDVRSMTQASGLPPEVRGSLSILLNPGGWLFLAAVASPLLATATLHGGTPGALLAALALVAGAAAGDAGLVLLGGLGLRRAGSRVVRGVQVALALVLVALGVWLVISGLAP